MDSPSNPATHVIALVTAAATLLLLFVGGLVTSKGAGLAVPDWPTTFGYPMFLYPWSKMVGDVFYEHSHRLVASAVGLLTLVLALLLWLQERRKWLRWLGTIALLLVILQGVIGGLRVLLLDETLAVVHSSLAQAFFALVVSLALFTSKEWTDEPEIRYLDSGRLRRLCILTSVMIYLQGVIGGLLRHTEAGLDSHLFFALLVALHVVLLCSRVLRSHSDQPRLVRPALLLGGLLLLQLGLGLGSYVGRFTPLGMALPTLAVELFRTAHVVAGALVLGASLVLTFRSYRWLTPPEHLGRHELFSRQASA